MIPKLAFGSTGHHSTRTLFGGAALSTVTQKHADQVLELLLKYGINHIDTAASYGDAELRIGPWMPEHRKRFFLATKSGERRYKKARDQIHKSLERLQTDRLDLIQLHNLVDPSEWETAMGPGGALEAAIEAKQQGLVRFIGVTGHGLTVAAQHKRALEAYAFDSVLLPYSYILMQHKQYASEFEALIKLCQERGVAVQTIKAITRRPWGSSQPNRATWYEPLTQPADIGQAVNWVLGRPEVFLCTTSDTGLLPHVLESASHLTGLPTDAEMDALLEREAMAPLFTA